MKSPGDAPLGSTYQVVARRYRPQSFDTLVGQSQVATALSNAINTNRVGHAYLFTGARGVGKTSSARIFAKCLNCESGPTETPCGNCEACLAVNDGQDVDVLEIDGASNRGIDEIRELRSNVNVRPSRSKFKIYIIDEVHMLTTQAFNALLKTLEEPPSHVKFIFCTTDPEKIPITVLSRCQRFDFAPVEADSIFERLMEICEKEGFTAEPDAISLLARRANGSMRDSQSLLEQLLSFCHQSITMQDVNQMLGTADIGRIKSVVGAIVDRNAKAALESFSIAISEGVECGQMGEQLVGYLRDMLISLTGCGKEHFLLAQPADYDEIAAQGQRFGLETTLACLQIFDESLNRLRTSSHSRVLLEMAIIRCCQLEHLELISALIEAAREGLPLTVNAAATDNRPPAPSAKIAPNAQTKEIQPTPKNPQPKAETKKKEVTRTEIPPSVESAVEINPANIEGYWLKTLEQLEDIAADYAGNYLSLAISAPNCLAVTLDSFYKEKCENPAVKSTLERAFEETTTRRFRIDFVTGAKPAAKVQAKPTTKRQQMRDLENHPLVRKAIDSFDGEILDVRKT